MIVVAVGTRILESYWKLVVYTDTLSVIRAIITGIEYYSDSRVFLNSLAYESLLKNDKGIKIE